MQRRFDASRPQRKLSTLRSSSRWTRYGVKRAYVSRKDGGLDVCEVRSRRRLAISNVLQVVAVVATAVPGKRIAPHLFDASVDVDVELFAKIEAHSVAEALRARGVRWVRQRDEGHPYRRAALAVGVADSIRSRVLRQGHQLVGALPRDELCFQVLLPSSVQLHSHLTTSSSSSGAAEELIRHAGKYRS